MIGFSYADDKLRVVVSSANLSRCMWEHVTNTVWWQDFPRCCGDATCKPTALWHDAPAEKRSCSNDFAAHLAAYADAAT